MSIKNKISNRFIKKDTLNSNKLLCFYKMNRLKIKRIVFFPLWWYFCLNERYKQHRNSKLEWSIDKTKKYLDKIMPKLAIKYCDDSTYIVISDSNEISGINFHNFYSSFDDAPIKKSIKQYFYKFRKKLFKYIMEEYEIDGYNKITTTNYAEWKKAQDEFDLNYIPYRSDNLKGVIFYLDK